ncbi:MAG: class I SAM-dependent methyltransferase [Myxococcota bacterium]|nr:class I SAM-dependent methyltransferase [Myxococcota bacterium]
MSTRPARARLRALPDDAPRERRFEALHAAIEEHYLAPGADAFQQSGRSSGASGWEPKRRCIADAIDHDGDLLDVGCANGLLLESLVAWCATKGVALRPHGIDFSWELVERARLRHPGLEAHFEVANGFWFHPEHRYDYVRSNTEYLLPGDRLEGARRLVSHALAPGGRLILCHYAGDDAVEDPAPLLEELGLRRIGRSGAPQVAVAWGDVGG